MNDDYINELTRDTNVEHQEFIRGTVLVNATPVQERNGYLYRSWHNSQHTVKNTNIINNLPMPSVASNAMSSTYAARFHQNYMNFVGSRIQGFGDVVYDVGEIIAIYLGTISLKNDSFDENLINLGWEDHGLLFRGNVINVEYKCVRGIFVEY